jgi:iron complex outermembrane recepter protein
MQSKVSRAVGEVLAARSQRRHVWGASMLASSILLTPAVMAQTENAETEELQEVVVTGRQAELFRPSTASSATGFSLDLSELPQSVSVITEDFLSTVGVTQLDDIFRFVPGVVNQGTEGFGGLESTLIARGRQIDTNRNFKLNGATFSNLGVLDLTGVERVEFPKGPTSLVYGFGSYGGIVNIITKQPKREQDVGFSGFFGSQDLIRIESDITGPLAAEGALRFRLGVGHERQNSFRDVEERESTAIVPTFAYDIGDRTELSLLGYYQNLRGKADSGLPYIGDDLDGNGFVDGNEPFGLPTQLPRSTFMGDPQQNDTSAQTRALISRLKTALGDDTELTVTGSYVNSSNYIQSIYGFTYTAPVALQNGLFEADSVLEDQDTESYVAEVSLLKRFTAFGEEQQLFLLGGVDTRRTERITAGICVPDALNIFALDFDSFDIPIPTSAQYDTGDGLCYGNGFNDRLTTYHAGGQLLLKPFSRVTFLLGARQDWLDRRYILQDSPASGGVGFAGSVLTDDSDTELSFRASTTIEITDNMRTFLHFARGFTPQLSLIRSGGVIGNEHGTQYEVGFKGEFLERSLSASLSVFRLDVTDGSIEDPNNAPGQNFFIAGGEERFKGAELELIGQIGKSLSVAAAYAYVESEILVADDASVVGRENIEGPNNKASLLVDYAFDNVSPLIDPLAVGLAATYNGRQRQSLDVDYGLPSFTLIDLNTSYELSKSTSISLNIFNLLDKTYFTPGPFDFLAFYGEPRTVRLGFDFQF